MSNIHNFIVDPQHHNIRLDKFLAINLLDLSRSKLKKIIEQGHVHLNKNCLTDCSYLIKTGQEIIIELVESKLCTIEPKKIDFGILFEDDDLLVIDKPAGLTVHPGAGNHDHTLVNALIEYCGESLSNIGGEARPGIVHRLDKDTSGLIIVAKNNYSHTKLSKALAERLIKRIYHTLVYGAPVINLGTVTTQMCKSKNNPRKMAIMHAGGRSATTHYRVLERFHNQLSLLECTLETGRTHQIRLHMEFKKTPVIGDQMYGRSLNFSLSEIDDVTKNYIKNFPRQALHARELHFTHPRSGESMNFTSDYPQDFKDLIKILRAA